ncbi:hypothetical protein T3A99_12560 [Pseudomonas sp. N-137]|uniref:hypothetical protein n=1 Tax=Pseudomonas sp. N-137 TaxID=3108452 RepID=UPI002ADEED2E|nr:hypothetical protein [Pseudomonas sp. N-137]MEA1029399.1 hypothetical protein [Pseudomonas sp. N-137]
MPWYKTGTVNVTLNSSAVIGTGTAFIANSRVGDAFRGPDGGWYEITNIASDTALAIDPPYQGATDAAGVYALAPMQGYVKGSADALRALVNQFGGVLAVLGEDPTQAGVRAALNLTNADGVPQGETNKYLTNSGVIGSVLTGLDPGASGSVVATDSVVAAFSKLKVNVDALQTGKAGSGVNADITELNALTKPVTPAQGGVSYGYIDGLIPTWNTTTSITVSPGAAYIPSTGKNLAVPTALTLSGFSLTSNTWYYLYLYDNAGTAAIELVTTAPTAPYSGTARGKSGDMTRRFLCALRSNAGIGLHSFQIDSARILRYRALLSSPPFRVVSAASQTTPTTVSLAAMVPPTTQTVEMLAVNGSGSVTIFLALPEDTASILARVGATANTQLTMITDSSQQFSFQNNAAGGAATFDVAGYGMDR